MCLHNTLHNIEEELIVQRTWGADGHYGGNLKLPSATLAFDIPTT